MSSVTPADSTYSYIASKVRRLTASSSESSLSTASLGQYINNFCNQNFPNSIKTDQMRAQFTLYTSPYVDQYWVDVNYWQGFRAPLYIDGYQATFYKERAQFYNIWPRFPTFLQPASGNGVTQAFSFTASAIPFLRNSVTLGCVSTTGAPIQITDNGSGRLYYVQTNPQVSIPSQVSPPNTNPAIPGMYNVNTRNPGQLTYTDIGSVDYVTGAFAFNLAAAPGSPIPASGELFRLFVYQYTTGRPLAAMYWNNYIIIRPVPKYVHKIEIEAYQTPVQFILTTDNPIINQWAKYIAYGAAIDILTDRGDMAGVANLYPPFKEQEGLVLERQAVEEITQQTPTIFTAGSYGGGTAYGSWGGWYW